jgi:hypothetical protein
MFFFEKKNQKTLTLRFTLKRCLARQPTRQKFFGSFFQKRTPSFLALALKAPDSCVGIYPLVDKILRLSPI